MRIEQTNVFAGALFNQNVNGVNHSSERSPLRFYNKSQQGKDALQQKRDEARQKAMKLVKNVYVADKKIDDDLAERADKVEKARADILEASKGIQEIDKYRAELKDTYGVEDDSQEQKDLELLVKYKNAFDPDSDVRLTKEEFERVQEISKQGLTEYQKASLEAEGWKGLYKKDIKDAKKVEREENAIINGIHQERLKSDPMVGAAKEAEDVMAAANKEIIGMILEEGKEAVDEKMEETKEDMQRAKEDKQEQEEHIEEIQQRNEEMEAQAEAHRSESKKHQQELLELATDQLLELDQIKSDVSQQVDNMLLDMKLLVEDIKGSVVDTEV